MVKNTLHLTQERSVEPTKTQLTEGWQLAKKCTPKALKNVLPLIRRAICTTYHAMLSGRCHMSLADKYLNQPFPFKPHTGGLRNHPMSIINIILFYPSVTKSLSKIDKHFKAQLAVEIFIFWDPVLARDAQWMQVAVGGFLFKKRFLPAASHNGISRAIDKLLGIRR